MNPLMEKLQRGLKSHQSGDLVAAERSYRQILRIDSGHSDALHLLGVVKMQSGAHADAVEKIEKAIHWNPANHIYHSNLGASYRGLGKFDAAIESYQEAIRLKPDYGQAWYNLGCVQEALEKWEEAESSYRKTIELLPDFFQAWNNLGSVLLQQKRVEDAEQAYLKLVALQPDSAEAVYNLGNTQLMKRDYPAARASLLRAQELNPKLEGLNFSLGQLAHFRGDLQGAVEFYHKELTDSPNEPKVLINLGHALTEKGDYAGAFVKYQQSLEGLQLRSLDEAQQLAARGKHLEAIPKFEQAIRENPDNQWCYTGMVHSCFEAGNAERAMELAEQAARIFPNEALVLFNYGSLLSHFGRKEDAVKVLQRSLELDPNSSDAQYQLGAILQEMGRGAEAEKLYRDALALSPQQFAALNNLGNIHAQRGEWELAREFFQKATEANPSSPETHNNIGNAFQNCKQYDQAIECYLRALELRPNYADALRNMGQALQMQGKHQEAIDAYEEAIRIRPEYKEAWNNLGIVYQKLGDHRQAEVSYREAIRLDPDYADARTNLAFVLQSRGDAEVAINDLRDLLGKRPEDSLTWNNLGIALAQKDRIEEAFAAYQKSALQDVHYADPHNNMGILHASIGQMTEAVKCYRRALELKPDFPEVYNNLGTAYQVQGSIDESLASFREALRLRPTYAEARSNFLFTLNYDVHITAEELKQEYQTWDRMCGQNVPVKPHANVADPKRRLRIGYVSPDFRTHSVAYYIEPILANHNPEEFEVFAYAQVFNPDGMTAKIQGHVHQWRNTCGLNDEQLAEQVRNDQIDILVDLTGHTGRNRLPMFAHKPAPVQVTYLGYPNTTGLSRMDYRFTDDLADPEGETAWHSEELIRLPHGFLCYKPPAVAPGMSLPPVLGNGYITFGSFNSQSKVHDEVIRIWAEVLKAIPNSKLILKSRPLADDGIKSRIWRMFSKHGVYRTRVELMSQIAATEGHLDAYKHIDIAVDTFPYNGTTTTCEALWMGVPVITLKGNTHASRVGVSLLSRIGLQDLIAQTPEQYVEIAKALSADRQRLLATRWSLRHRLQNSDLCNQKLITRDMEIAYRQMWQRWCGQGK